MSAPCWTVNVAITSAVTILGVVATIDAIVREVPPLIAKARFCVVPLFVIHIAQEINADQPNNNTQQAWLEILHLPFLLPLILFFLENYAVTWEASSLSPTTPALEKLKQFLKVFPVIRIGSVLYAIALGVLYEFFPTNAVMIAWTAGRAFGWVMGMLMMFFVLRVALVLRWHLKQTSTLEAANRDPMKRTQWQMFAFVAAGIVITMSSIISELIVIRDLSRNPLDVWQSPACGSDTAGITVKYALLACALVTTRCPKAERRTFRTSTRSTSGSTSGSGGTKHLTRNRRPHSAHTTQSKSLPTNTSASSPTTDEHVDPFPN